MGYSYNRTAFKAVRTHLELPPLLLSYCSLVLAELALKEHLNLVGSSAHCGHDLPQLLDRLRPGTEGGKRSLAAMKTQFRQRLAKLRCQTRKGIPGFVPESSYPHIRYLRHADDWSADHSTDADVKQLKIMVDRLLDFLSRDIRVRL